ncbi:MAG: hypothetical protein ACOX6D_02470 [Thermoguttaceae bacterium]|jgi:hypothetical protein
MESNARGDSAATRHSLVKDIKTPKDRFRRETDGKFPASPSRFSLSTALFFYWIYAAVIYGGAVCLIRFFCEAYPLRAAFYAGGVVFTAGNLAICCAFYCKKKYGALVELLVSLAVRTGLPLAVALVLCCTMDKILGRAVILTLAAFYVLTLPFEVWVTLPGRPVSVCNKDSQKKEESVKDERRTD